MLRGQIDRQWKGTYDLHFNHHKDLASFQASATDSNCGICKPLFRQWRRAINAAQGVFEADVEIDSRLGLSPETIALYPGFQIAATLSLVPPHLKLEPRYLYRLDLTVSYSKEKVDSIWERVRRTFILRTVGKSSIAFSC